MFFVHFTMVTMNGIFQIGLLYLYMNAYFHGGCVTISVITNCHGDIDIRQKRDKK